MPLMHGCLTAAGRRLAAAVTLTFILAVPPAAAAATYEVTTTSDTRVCDETSCGLRGALAIAKDGDTIHLPASDTPYNQQSGPFRVTTGVTIVGDGAGKTRVTGDTGQTFVIGDPQAPARTVVTLAHLQVAYGHDLYGPGGNIVNYGDLTLDHVRVAYGQAGWGGGIANMPGGTLKVTHSLIDHNQAVSDDATEEGGGIYSESYAGGGLVVTDSTVAFNQARIGAGIAVYYGGEASSVITGVLERVTIARNQDGLATPAGLLLGPRALVQVQGSIIAENTAMTGVVARSAVITSNCNPQVPPLDEGGNLSDTDECGFKTRGDPQFSTTLVEGPGDTPLLTIAPTSPAVDLAGDCQGTDQRDLARPQGDACDAGAYEVAAPPVISGGPPPTTSETSASFEFSPDENTECKLDGPTPSDWTGCTSPKRYASLAPGTYTFSVRAAGAGEPVSRSFTVTTTQGATPTPAPPPPATPAQTPVPPAPVATPPPTPRYGEQVVVRPTRGTIRVKLAGTNRYVELATVDDLPLGSSIDARKGRVRLYSARDRSGRVQAASFFGGVFKITQHGSYTVLQLRGPKPVCGSSQSKGTASAAGKPKPKHTKRKRRVRHLWGSGKGRFRTSGRLSSATVRGTKWLVQDSCHSTTTRVVRGVVAVRDFARHKTILLRAGNRYVARKTRK